MIETPADRWTLLNGTIVCACASLVAAVRGGQDAPGKYHAKADFINGVDNSTPVSKTPHTLIP